MANLVITGVCNLKCPYCFADPHMQTLKADAAPKFISLETFEERLDFLDRSGIDEIRLIGGEPTLHPQFAELIRRALPRGKHILIFSHGLMPESALACLEALPPERYTVLVNMNATRYPDGPDERELARRCETVRRLGPRALLGFNIYSTAFDADFLLPLIETMKCHKAIRLGLAQPALFGQNAYLHPKQYPVVGQKIVRLAKRAAQSGIRLEFDCGFVRCMFSDDDLALLRQVNTDLGWRCNPILDLDMEGRAIHCFPLTGKLETPLERESDAAGLRAALGEQAAPYRLAGVYRECSTCRFKKAGECMGGCLAAALKRFRHASIRVNVPSPAQDHRIVS